MMPNQNNQPPTPPKQNLPEKEESDTHSYEIHFAPDDVQNTIKTEFGSDITGRELLHIMRKIDTLV
jgi:hypothetical protein